ncbi:hypothetical protein F2P81_005359 [Scophthalmus maximus]|uniref:Uncharacterized protein n=1 Tax=Scophthalmus maximus TaxID=52904 RepID=A0A6A4T693_SCOMX|nr:hypothetical protein F2P81_005359 [Scophthalmus maximus]
MAVSDESSQRCRRQLATAPLRYGGQSDEKTRLGTQPGGRCRLMCCVNHIPNRRLENSREQIQRDAVEPLPLSGIFQSGDRVAAEILALLNPERNDKAWRFQCFRREEVRAAIVINRVCLNKNRKRTNPAFQLKIRAVHLNRDLSRYRTNVRYRYQISAGFLNVITLSLLKNRRKKS